MNDDYNYSINLDTKFDFLELIDVPELADSVTESWFNQTLCQVNDSVIRLGVVQGEFHWHSHTEEDEFFFVLQGEFLIDLEGQSIKLGPHQGFAIPKGMLHRTRAPERTVILMVESSSIIPTGDAASAE